MTEHKIVVPEGMINAAAESLQSFDDCIPVVLEAALRWLSENPIVPNEGQLIAFQKNWIDADGNRQGSFYLYVLVEWQRRMFLAPEPEVPKDLLFVDDRKDLWADEVNHRIKLAYMEGQKAGPDAR